MCIARPGGIVRPPPLSVMDFIEQEFFQGRETLEPTAEDILAQQGTRLSEKAPWESYGDEMETRMSPELAAAVAEYSERRYDLVEASNQNKELLAEEKELSDELAKQYQWLTPDEYRDHYQRIGRVMSHAEFITLLRKAGVQCWYTQHPHPDKAVLLVSHKSDLREVACWVQMGQMPELSIMAFDDHGVPLAEKRRGWRTPLLQLILKSYITEETANMVFGAPKQTEAYHRYNSLLFEFRKAGGSLAL